MEKKHIIRLIISLIVIAVVTVCLSGLVTGGHVMYGASEADETANVDTVG